MSDKDERNHASEGTGQTADRKGDGQQNVGAQLFIAVVELLGILASIPSTLVKGFRSKSPSPVQAAAGPAPVRAPEKTGRAADRNLNPRSDTAGHQRWGTLLAACTFAAGIVAGVGFLVVYWTGGSNLLLGGTLALFFGGIGLSLVLYSHWLMADRQAIEPREELPSNTEEREAVWKDFYAEHDFRRRSLLKWIGVGTVGMIGAIFVSVFRSLGRPPGPSLFTTVWKRGQQLTTLDGTPVTVNALQPGNFIIVFPKENIGDERAQTVLIRVKQASLRLPKERASWAPMGYVAYSRVCTHAGCTVGMFEPTTDLLMCPCHQSTFDVLRAAQPTSGPAARPLPQLPLYADAEGNLRAGGGFTEPPGPGFWEMP